MKFTVSHAMAALHAAGHDYMPMLKKNCGDIAFYRPRPTDPQGPHLRDEVYFIASGRGTFICNGERFSFEERDVFFVPRATEHRFEDFSDDFAAWVIFFGASPSRDPASSTGE
jgi:mannose-6-phosphate isomerase-like protein (cupin superfamily)